jgi:hypothetical protein
MVEKIAAANNNLISIETKIYTIKERDLQSTDDYIKAYGEIDNHLPGFASAIENCSDVYKQARQVDVQRGFINTQVFYKSHVPDLWNNNFAMLDLLRKINSLTSQEVSSVRKMAALPKSEQVAFWQREVQPLLEEDDKLREEVRTLAARIQSPKK